MAASENGLFFVHEFKSIYTEYTIEMIVPEGYVARLSLIINECHLLQDLYRSINNDET